VRLEREGDGGTLLVEGPRADGTIVVAHTDGNEKHFVLLDADELRWLTTMALPAILAATR
jgi:hypothetical protein